jgi:rod shape-determining protein MreD
VRNVLHGALILLAAVLLQFLAGPALADHLFGLDLFPIAVILFAMSKGDLAGAVMGVVAGLAADTFSLGVFGVSGLVLTAVGFLAGWISRRFSVTALARSFLFILLFAALDLLLRAGLAAALLSEPVPWNGGRLLFQPPAAAVIGTAALALYRRFRKTHAR